MGREKDLDNILEECLERLARGETIEQCLAGYPAEAAELEPLLRTAILVKKATVIVPRAEFRERARYQFRSAVCEAAQPRPRRTFGWLSWQPRWATAAIAAVLIFVIAGSGTLAAASNSMPDDTLYPVKLTAENIRLTLTRSDSAKAQLYASLADKRVSEIVKMAEKGKVEQVERATDRLDAYLQKVVVLAAPASKGAVAMQAPLAAPAPAAAPTRVPAATRTPTPVPTPTVVATPTPSPTPTPDPRLGALQASPVPEQATKDASVKSRTAREATTKDKSTVNRAKVKAVIAEAALKHPEALKAALKNAPESVKPALRKAIAVSVADYRQALEALENEETP